ncbi:uncharacterized protein LOC113997719, partial [Pipra filicauda]|uniref:Uncharacterized protein LOC113997719 n=1 Tax=Pipra filicauda TaxID=649802 RepID=A0A7R5L186_9PASS
MPILLFLIDTSASMNQRAYLGTSYLDIAKGAVEIFMKLRARDPASRGDRYMLVTFDEPPYCIKVMTPPGRPAPAAGAALGAARPRPARRRQQQPVKMADILLLYGGERLRALLRWRRGGGGDGRAVIHRPGAARGGRAPPPAGRWLRRGRAGIRPRSAPTPPGHAGGGRWVRWVLPDPEGQRWGSGPLTAAGPRRAVGRSARACSPPLRGKKKPRCWDLVSPPFLLLSTVTRT